jgi:hypothetical protein
LNRHSMLFDNFSGKPGFAYDHEPYGFYHLNLDSECRNAGDNSFVEQDEVDMDGDVRIADMVVDIGADEVSCEDTSHELDWNADGIVNMSEFYDFSVAWLTRDPNDPQMPQGIDPNDFVHWDPRCDLDHDYDVDLADLVIFADYRNANWLWVACWRENFQQTQGSMMNMLKTQSESELISQDSVSAFSISQDSPKTIQQQVFELQDSIKFLEQLWLNDNFIRSEIDALEWQRFMNKVYQSMNEIQTIGNKTYIKEIER